jgi:hypothetical protein
MSYIGQGLGQGKAERFIFTASGGETSVTLDDAGRGIAYTPGQVDVYLNGVKLVNGTDFTATSGSSITGLSALSASDVVEIVALDAFSPADTVSAASGGSFGDAVTITDASNNPLTLNRTTSDGDIQVFKKDGTTVGSIGTKGGDLVIGTTDVAVRFDDNLNAIYPHDIATNIATDAAADLGLSTARFKNLYLSGGVYLGGTGSANYLDDYETGTYNPTITTGSGSITLNTANNTLSYTKIGRVVRITGRINVTSVSSPAGSTKISLPFAAESGTEDSGFNYGDLVLHNINIPSSVTRVFTEISPSAAQAQMRSQVSNSAWPIFDASNFDGSGTEYIGFNFTYTAA